MGALGRPLRHSRSAPVASVRNQRIAEAVLALAREIRICEQVLHFAPWINRHHQDVLERTLLRVEQPAPLALGA